MRLYIYIYIYIWRRLLCFVRGRGLQIDRGKDGQTNAGKFPYKVTTTCGHRRHGHTTFGHTHTHGHTTCCHTRCGHTKSITQTAVKQILVAHMRSNTAAMNHYVANCKETFEDQPGSKQPHRDDRPPGYNPVPG